MVSNEWEIDTDTAPDHRIYNYEGHDNAILVQNIGDHSVWIHPFQSRYPMGERYLLRPHETHIFENSGFFLQLFYTLETAGDETIILVQIYN